ncbi:radical SAM protein [Mediterraneibacter gnavus]
MAWGSKYFCVEVSRGCPENCSYCATRWAVGKLHSKPVEKCVSEIKLFNESNADKVVINGDNVGAYGLDIGESFGSLIQELPLVENGYSALIDSLHPKWLLKYYDSILDAAQKNTLGMIVSAIQSGSERIIKLMRRKADMNQLKKAFLELKKVSPQLILGTEVIIGFPTETDTELEESIKFVLDTKIDWGHLFIFSPKDGTEAAAMEGQVDENIKIKRINHFIEQLKANDYLVHKEEKSQAVIFCRKEVCMKSREADNVFWKHCFDTICPNEQGQEELLEIYRNTGDISNTIR